MIPCPHNKTVICELANKAKHEEEVHGFVYEQQDVPVFKVISVSQDLCDEWKIGDLVLADCTPTKIVVDSHDYYIIRSEHIAGKLS